ncbi:4-hydroxy-tetrahydrodipicolinate synthase [Limihaloglobus sulfuriphilus]|uniref:4-hydroxy-tetrahydrodipicolinate synthase n=1 Tax=Limihaloglobus sulfuriphilus TaxID=1851148 RepID=A0A1Q2MG85_9BACT|nr:dihydrodipicolinate synthase family protein [Limihaloglobus sulfuriphilus]AQQ71691.1 4-hydroxy-tetrahydrodipicolinate synthase [Limihaloglobus sulfuriphilus]
MNRNLPKPLRGIIVPLVTPLSGRDSIDVNGLERLVSRVIKGGVSGIFILGTTGEGPGLSYRLRTEMIELTCKFNAGRVPVLAGITDTAFEESVSVARTAQLNGANGLVLAPPYYFAANQKELLSYIEHLVPELPLPVYLYNMPFQTKVFIEPDTVARASKIPGVWGIKDSSADMVYFHKLQRIFRNDPEFSLLVGPEELLAESLISGAHGGVNGGANLLPQLYVALYNKVMEGDERAVQALHKQVMDVSMSVYSVCSSGSAYLKGLKCALSLFGICSDFMAEPFGRCSSAEREAIQENLVRAGILKLEDRQKVKIQNTASARSSFSGAGCGLARDAFGE